MSLKVYNTLSGTKEIFVPLKEGEVRMYVCGITAYDQCHVGHARALFTFDIVFRYLKFLGYRVFFVRNITDLDDKIIQRARQESISTETIAERYIQEFYRDSAALGLVIPTHEPRATAHVPEMIDLICRLEQRGLAYRVNGDVFFPVDRFPGYGKLSRRKLEELQAGARVEVDERKRHPMDFSLWKQSKQGEPFWESPWGKGRPGWHIECSAMSTKYLGQPFDIHGGGRDLVFPHHENEIAQSEGAFGVPFARYWMHNGFVNINQDKMSKSLGNVYTIREVLDRFDASALRHYILASHYRSPLDFSEQGLEEAERGVERIYETADRLERLSSSNGLVKSEAGLLEEFRQEMDDDFNTPRAIALMFEEIRSLNRMLDEGKSEGLGPRRGALRAMGEVLGVLQEQPKTFREKKKERWLRSRGLSCREIGELVRRRDRARSEKQWQEADRIRSELKEKGITLEDTTRGTIWKVR
ncbi:MAG: cysteine--tRNA ligase [Candidatus Binatia bacterium]